MSNKGLQGLLAIGLFLSLAGPIPAELYINEIFFDPPGSGDNSQEYIELRGTPGMSLDNHYLIFLESENDRLDTKNPGQVEVKFDLGRRSLSPTGFFSLRQRGTPYSLPGDPSNPFNAVNTITVPGQVVGWGSSPTFDNNVGAYTSFAYSTEPGRIENSGFTAMLVRVNAGGSAPTLGMNLDGSINNDGNSDTIHDGLDYPNGVPDLSPGVPAWTIVDSIGVFSEGTSINQAGEAIFGRTYAALNFGPEIPGQSYTFRENGVLTAVTFQPNLTAGQTYVGLGYEIEHIARWGNSTGQSAADWHITNVTDKPLSGYTSPADGFRQSGHLHDNPNDDFVETNQFVPYGANLNNTIGAANYPLNLSQLPWDYNHNGEVDAADYIIWRETLGQIGIGMPADGNGGRSIESDDHTFWRGRFGDKLGGGAQGFEAGGSAVPEPAASILAMSIGVIFLFFRTAFSRC